MSITPADAWFELDPEPKFLILPDGRTVGSNSAAANALEEGLVSKDSLGVLRFGSANSDACFLSALKTPDPHGPSRRRLVLRGRNGAWLAANLFRMKEDPVAILSLKVEASPAREAFTALADAFNMTRAEAEVLYTLTEGRCPKEIANQLAISEHTVRAHLRVIYTKMDVKGLAGTIRRTAHLT